MLRLRSWSLYGGNVATQRQKTPLQPVIYRLDGKSNNPTQIFELLFVSGRALAAHTRADCIWFCLDKGSNRGRAGSERLFQAVPTRRAGAPAPRALSTLGKLVPGALSGCRSRTVVDHEDQHRQKLQRVNPPPGARGE